MKDCYLGKVIQVLVGNMEHLAETGSYRKTLLLGLVSLVLGTIASWFFFRQELSVNYPLFLALASIAALILAHVHAKQVTLEQYILIALTLFFALFVFVRASELLTLCNLLMSVPCAFIATRSLAGKSIRTFYPIQYIESFFLPFLFIGPLWSTFPELFAFRKNVAKNSMSKEIVRGSIMAGVAVVIFSALFASADDVFGDMLGKIFSFNIDEETFGRVVFGSVVTLFFIGAFGFIFRKIHASSAPAALGKERTLGSLETSILFGAINLLFFVFILFQFTYLFGGNEHVLAQGLTYADYARKGFFELVVVAILSYFIISVSEKQIVKREGAHLSSFKLLSSILVGEVVIILVSAFMRLSLYEHTYGFTTIRLYSHGFMIWLSVALLLLAFTIWKSGRREVFALRVFASIVLFLFIMNLLNPDAFIAKQNIERYTLSGKIDANYLAELSADAIPYTVILLDDKDTLVHNNFAGSLNYSQYFERSASWQETNLSVEKAKQLLAPKNELLLKYRHVVSPLSDPDPF